MIFGIIQSASISIGLAFTAQIFFNKIESIFAFEFLRSNIINLQVALLAVNIATLGIILTKIREIIDKNGIEARENFTKTRKEMILSVREQISLIIFSLLIISLQSTNLHFIKSSNNILHGLLLASFFYSLLILYDTAKCIFLILDC